VKRRQGLSVLEVLVALAILAIGVVPLFQLFSTSRGVLGQSQEMLRLENAAMQVVEEGRALAHAGHFSELRPEQEELLELDEAGVRTRLVVTRLPAERLFRLAVRAEGKVRFFQATFLVSDPLAGLETWDAVDGEGASS